MASGYDIAGLALGVLGFSAVIQLGWDTLDSCLPTQQLKALDDVLSDTHEIFKSAAEEALFPDLATAEDIENDLLSLRDKTETFRAKVYTATNFTSQFRGLVNGLSWNIASVSSEVAIIRARISRLSEDMRREQEAEPQSLKSYSMDSYHAPEGSGSHTPFSSFNIPAEEHLLGLQAPSPAVHRPDPIINGSSNGVSGHVYEGSMRHREVSSVASIYRPASPVDALEAETAEVDLSAVPTTLHVVPRQEPAPIGQSVNIADPVADLPVVDVAATAQPAFATAPPVVSTSPGLSLPPAGPTYEELYEMVHRVNGNVSALAEILQRQQSGQPIDTNTVLVVMEDTRRVAAACESVAPPAYDAGEDIPVLPSPPTTILVEKSDIPVLPSPPTTAPVEKSDDPSSSIEKPSVKEAEGPLPA